MKKIITWMALGTIWAGGGMAGEEMQKHFASPPAVARPVTWWHWLDGNVTREGITADLESMRRIGLGGAYMFNCGVGMPAGDVRFMQPRWMDLMEHSIKESQRLGLTFGVHNCDGFSQSGGPWITPETSMKQWTWTAGEFEGGQMLDVRLEKPPIKEDFYRDIAVVAFPVPAGARIVGPGTDTQIRGSLPAAALRSLVDGKKETRVLFPATESSNVVDFVFSQPRTVRSIVCHRAEPHRWEEDFPIQMEVSADGTHFTPVGTFTVNWDMVEGEGITVACDAVEGTVFRVWCRNPWNFSIGEIELSESARVHFAESKAGRIRSRGHGAERRHYDNYPGPDRRRTLAPEFVVARDTVQDLTARMDGDGRLRWKAPPGRWRVLRVGYTSNGHYVSPATPEGRGLECDKLDARAMRFHLEQYVGKLVKLAGSAAGTTFSAMEVDSWECGIQNWSAGLERRFKTRVGYDLLPFLPALIEGWIVDSADVSERAMWDWRRFLSDQFAENYYRVVLQFAQEKKLTYVAESTGRQQYLYDAANMRHSMVPMGEFWNNTEAGQGVRVDNKLASSIAHTVGLPVVASESYTSGGEHAAWDNHPFSMKALGDRAFCAGVNQFVFHTFAHQPYRVTGPGFTFASWGLNFNRANTWWEPAHAWMTYLTRCNFMLREGRPVADVLFFVGEDVPNRIAWRDELRPELPMGYDFDGCDARAVMDARVKDGRVLLPSGTEYRVLLLPHLETMRPALLEKVHRLVAAGATVLGPRPRQSPSLRDVGAGDHKVRQLAEKLWTGTDRRVYSDTTFKDVFARIQLLPDFEWQGTPADGEVLYIHRRTDAADIYFVSNQRYAAQDLHATFRVAGRSPEIWDPATGAIKRPGVFESKDGRTTIPLRLTAGESVFVVFRDVAPVRHLVSWEAATGAASPEWERAADGRLVALWRAGGAGVAVLNDGRRVEVKAPAVEAPRPVDGVWQVRFPPGLGAPPATTLDTLVSWSTHPDEGVRHFSGTAVYEKDIEIPAGMLGAHRSLYLDLGEVAVIADVELNGVPLATLWKPPFRVRIDGAARAGVNRLTVRVTNLWRNRMIGDAALPDDTEWGKAGRGSAYPVRWPDWLVQGSPRPSPRVGFCSRKDVYPKDAPLLPSGLLGPVVLQPVVDVTLDP